MHLHAIKPEPSEKILAALYQISPGLELKVIDDQFFYRGTNQYNEVWTLLIWEASSWEYVLNRWRESGAKIESVNLSRWIQDD